MVGERRSMPDDFDYSQPRQQENLVIEVPVISYALIALCVLVTLAHYTSSPGPDLWSRIGHFGDPDSADVWDGRYYQLFTAIFLHSDFRGAGLMHIVFNMMWLYQLGPILEHTMGRSRYLGFIIASAFIGSCAEMAVSGNVGIGFSGIVYAMFGLTWGGRGFHPVWDAVANDANKRTFIGWGLLCLVLTVANYLRIANGAHFGGLLFGFCVGKLVFAPRRKPIFAAPLGALVALCIVALLYMPWQWQWDLWKAGREFDAQRYPAAVKWYDVCLRHGGPPDVCWENTAGAWHNLGIDARQRGDAALAARAKVNESEAEDKLAASEAAKSN